jgi:hypothetical protein
MAGRTRIQIPACRSDVPYFERVMRELGAIEAVEGVDANPLTGSVLIHHGEDVNPIIEKALELQLFELGTPDSGQSGPVLSARVRAHLTEADRRIREATHGRLDFNGLAMVALVGAGTFQMLRGEVLPAGASLLWYALGLAWSRPPKPE